LAKARQKEKTKVSRITFTIPIRPGRQDECIRILSKYKRVLDKVHLEIGVTQWIKWIDRDQYVELIEWRGKTFEQLLEDFFARPELKEFLAEITPHLLTPKVAIGEDPVAVTAAFHQGASMKEAYSLVPPPR
jgi:hypothetical protein